MPSEQYHVVMSTFRARGGGGHMTVGVGLSAEELPGRILWVSEKDVRTIFREYLTSRSPCDAKTNGSLEISLKLPTFANRRNDMKGKKRYTVYRKKRRSIGR